MLNTIRTIRTDRTNKTEVLCTCGSGKKYKNWCGKNAKTIENSKLQKIQKTQKYSGVDKNVHNVYTNKKFCGQKTRVIEKNHPYFYTLK